MSENQGNEQQWCNRIINQPSPGGGARSQASFERERGHRPPAGLPNTASCSVRRRQAAGFSVLVICLTTAFPPLPIANFALNKLAVRDLPPLALPSATQPPVWSTESASCMDRWVQP